jgi:hypothetical protein
MKMKMKPDDQLQHNAEQILASAERQQNSRTIFSRSVENR